MALIFLGGASTASNAQPSLGIVWEIPSDTATAIQQLDQYAYHGIQYLEVQYPADSRILDILEGSSFTLLVRSDKNFILLDELNEDRNQFLEEYIGLAEQYRSNLNVASIGLLSNSQTQNPEFLNTFQPIIDSLYSQSSKSFYFYSHHRWHYFDSPNQYFALLFADQDYQPNDLAEFDEAFKSEVSTQSKLIFFVHSTWFDEAISSYPELSETILAYQAGDDWKLPLPEVQEEPASQNWMVFILVLLWVALAVQVKYLPYIRPMLLRYFLAHRFFVDDIIHYRERAATGGIFLMIKHAIFSGMVFFIIAQATISETGLTAFFHHFPSLAIAGSTYATFFLLGVIITLLTQLIAIFWLYLPAKNLEHFSQVINLYAGSFFLDFFTVTFLLTLSITGFGTPVLMSLAGLFVLIWYGAFNIAAFDISGNMGPGRLLYLMLTIVLHLVITGIMLGIIFANPSWIQAIELSLSI